MEILIWFVFGLQMLLAAIVIIGAIFWIFVMLFLVLGYVPWVPTTGKEAKTMLDLTEVKEGETVLDLGCGMANMLIMAANNYGAKGIGYDINPALVVAANVHTRLKGVRKDVKVRYGDLTKVDIPQADVVTVYLYKEVNKILAPRLKAALPKGTRVVSRTFPFEMWALKEAVKSEKETYYLYEL
ncbi:MAG: methyltransferase domain-containing protein [bacterium]|nr:methyltransferase domain-containing protein [bacterium]